MGDEQRAGGFHACTGYGHGDILDNGTRKTGYGIIAKTKTEQGRYGRNNIETEWRKHGKSANTRTAARGHYHAVSMMTPPVGEHYVIAATISHSYAACTMVGKNGHALAAHHGEKGVDYLHGILRHGKNTLVVLGEESHASLLKPSVGILVTEFLEKPLHQPVSTRIYRLHALHSTEGIGEVAASASRHGDLGQGFRSALENGNLGRGKHPHDVGGSKTTSCSGSDDGYAHVWVSGWQRNNSRWRQARQRWQEWPPCEKGSWQPSL